MVSDDNVNSFQLPSGPLSWSRKFIQGLWSLIISRRWSKLSIFIYLYHIILFSLDTRCPCIYYLFLFFYIKIVKDFAIQL